MVLFALVILTATCRKDNSMEDMPAPPGIEITSDLADGEAGCIGQLVSIEFKLTAPSVIRNFTINKNGNQELVNRNDVPVNEFTFSTTYQLANDDLDNGSVALFVTLTDRDGRTASAEISFIVVAEFAYTIDNVSPLPSWDIAHNINVSTKTGDSVDVYLQRETQSCGSFCTYFRYTLVSGNTTRFFNIPQQPDVNYINNRFKVADVEAILHGLSAETELVLYSTYPEDVTAMGALNNLPLVISIRDSREYAILDADISDPGNPRLRYRKRSETAGQ